MPPLLYSAVYRVHGRVSSYHINPMRPLDTTLLISRRAFARFRFTLPSSVPGNLPPSFILITLVLNKVLHKIHDKGTQY